MRLDLIYESYGFFYGGWGLSLAPCRNWFVETVHPPYVSQQRSSVKLNTTPHDLTGHQSISFRETRNPDSRPCDSGTITVLHQNMD